MRLLPSEAIPPTMRRTARRRGLFQVVNLLLAPLAWVCMRVAGPYPRRPERHPMVFGYTGVVAFSTLPDLLGVSQFPPSLASISWFGRISATTICIGAVGILVTMFWPRPDQRIVIEQVADTFLGFGLLCYGAAAVALSGWNNAALAAGQAWGISAGTGIRYAQIWWFLRRKREIEALDRMG